MPIAYLTSVVEFTATHRFPDLPDFAGATRDHSHLYKCEVTVKGRFDPTRGGVMSLKVLHALLKREVIARFDGRHINEDIDIFGAGTWLATGEGLAVYVWERLAEAGLPAGVALHRVRVQEGANLYSEYYGEP
ncbi:MAG TPA: 6-carboxytetrahydropterin synthase [Gemmatimonadales bacterium]|nr:6-carboxytetrahydropterin synthase [Gemmatimonadales bacterium]